jgi:predicted nucleic acid-binding protein
LLIRAPLRYLIFIDQIGLLPLLYGRIVIPREVMRELTQTATPQSVHIWMDHLPEWVSVKSPQQPLSDFSAVLGSGEQEAIALAEELTADVLLVDDETARREAERRGIPVQGTLGVLDLAAEHGFLPDLPDAIRRLRDTNFRASEKLLNFFLERDAVRKKGKGTAGNNPHR